MTRLILGLFLLLVAVPLAGQDASLQGIVTDDVSGRAIEGASVVLQPAAGQQRGDFTDRNGFYQIGAIPPGSYTLEVSYLGYVTHRQTLPLAPDERLTLSVPLTLDAVLIEGVTVTPTRGAVDREMGRQLITPAELRLVPMPAGSGDLASYLQTLPGVVSTGDRGGQLFIRGGTPAENMSLIDGAMIYQPFHIIGFFSAFPEDLVSSVDFYAGGFGARYSGRTSSVLDVQMRDGNRTSFAGTGTVSPFVAELVAEGPLDGDRVSWMAAARRSLIQETSPTLLGEEQPLTFESQFLKVTSFNEAGSRCSATALRTADSGRMDVEDPVSRVSWGNLVLGGRCTVLFDRILRLLEVNMSYSSADNAAITRGASSLRSKISRLQHEVHTTNLLRSIPIYAGYHVAAEDIDYDLSELFVGQGFKGSVWDINTYAEASILLGSKIELRPGVVMNFMPTAGLDGRFRASWKPLGSDDQIVNAAVGSYRQDVAGVSDQRDVASVFTAWTEPRRGGSLQAFHAILGWQQELGAGVSWSLEGYYKKIRNTFIPTWRAATDYATTLARADGEVRGADLRLEYRVPSFYGFIGYGYGWTQYETEQQYFEQWYGDPVQTYHPPHDRRHQANVLLSWEVRGLTAGARWQLGTGFPFTRPRGIEEAFHFQAGLEDMRRRGDTRLLVDRPYEGRLPIIHRLDLSLKKEIDLSFGSLELQAGAVNAYDRPNMFFYDLQTNRRVDQLPLTPYVSLRLEAR